MSIATPATDTGYYAFSNPSQSRPASIAYDHNLEELVLRAASNNTCIIDENGIYLQDNTTINMLLSTEGNTAIGPDIQFYGAGLIAAESSVYVAIDSTDSTTTGVFEILKDAANTTSGVPMFRFAESGLASLPNGGVFQLMLAHLYKTSDQTLTGTYADITWNTEVELEANTFSHSTDAAPITVLETGIYKVTLTVTTVVTSGTDRSGARFKLQEDSSGSYVDVPGTQISTYARDATTAYNTATCIGIVSLDAGDRIKAQGYQYDGTSTVDIDADGTTITIERID